MTRVHVIGAGLLGASTGLALRRAGHEVTLADTSPTAAALASDMGAGRVAHAQDEAPDLVVVAATGAYCYSMSSNYNAFGRPAVVAVRAGHTKPMLKRETVEDLLAREYEGLSYTL